MTFELATTWAELLESAASALGDRAEARWVIEDAAGEGWSSLRARLSDPAPPPARQACEVLVERRLSGAPLQHVLGHWSFRTLDLLVDGRALVPRPETEIVVEHALAALDERAAAQACAEQTCAARDSGAPAAALLAVDLGTGGGAIACALVAERPGVRVVATDSSGDALALAAANVARLDPAAAARVELLEGDWYAALPAELAGRVDLVVSNPPYLAESELAGLEAVVAAHDPLAALVAGPEGTEAIASVVVGAPAVLAPGGVLVVEIAPHQAAAARAVAARAGARSSRVEPDLAGRERVLVASW
ncbi:MAG TPA: peptide chain release factor N(5)-glutamine methyltransferase [Acidimicrobiales bacterium]|nr:peptide chain release factor N(5)-glutamine methyltransferase [Acidimicrobiales bacterium]